ncbi:MAG: gliding motility-associated C-terminal domain-containing protein [Arenibacter latericius]|nr:gliding motility-associated C-terminal domain-containing protein [Arenibacter latericius]
MRYLYLLILLSGSVMAQNANLHNMGEVFVNPNTLVSIRSSFFNETKASFINEGQVYFYGDVENNGVLDFTRDTGLSVFVGNRLQKFQGTEPIYFNNLLFENTSAKVPFHLYNEINVYGQVNFQNGIVDNENFGGTFIFRDDANHINASDLSHVNGIVNKLGDKEFIFPVGDEGYYRFAGTSAIGGANNYQTQYFLENSGSLFPHTHKPETIQLINSAEYWTIEPITNLEDQVMISLSWREETSPEEVIAAPQEDNIHIVRWDVELDKWVDEGGVVNSSDKTVSTAVEKFGVFTLARVKIDKTLPCEITVYNAITPNNDGLNDFFRIEMSDETCVQNLNVQIFNRWGVKVYEADNYGQGGNVFRGYSDGRATLRGDRKLPPGTYFYILNYDYETGNGLDRQKEAGYLFLSGN